MITSVVDHRAMKSALRQAIESYTTKYILNAKNGTLRIWHKIRLFLLEVLLLF